MASHFSSRKAPNTKRGEVGGDYWYFPLFPDKTVIADPNSLEASLVDFLNNNYDELTKEDRYFGIWLNPNDQKYYLDINTRTKTKNAALNEATEIHRVSRRKIQAIYNPRK